ncbi:MAG: hypothetical protein F6K36_01170 [Symploca sp. SIO3C6]|nr:hypothetical protein [Symploca sp. SIO3C6]NET06672.1 hypothetical protein [Symploca sp. SIO2B6]
MSFGSRFLQLLPVPILLSSIINLGIPQHTLAQTLKTPEPCSEPLEVELMAPGATLPTQREIITANTIRQTQSQTGIKYPSLWWAQEQFNQFFGGKLINNWIVYPKHKRLDLIVNLQIWVILDYIERYSLVDKFGTIARNYKYNVRVFNQQADILATYTCDYTKDTPVCEFRGCELFGEDSLQLPRR